MIKYLGSKRRLVPVLLAMATASRPRTALDLFSGTARVAKALKEAGCEVTAVDSASYAHVLAETYVATDARELREADLRRALGHLEAKAGRRGYVTEVFCETARYFHPDNGRRIDAIRDEIELSYAGTPLHPVLLTSLLEAADRVDSTTGVQMAFLKRWAPRALRPLELRAPSLSVGPGRAVLGDAATLAGSPQLEPVDVAYLDPPYNQHRYLGNYHVWETLVRWDAPEHYGVACKRIDCRGDGRASPFNRRREMPVALAQVIDAVEAELVLVSYNDESWVSAAELIEMGRARLRRLGEDEEEGVAVLAVDQARYVGARIGIHNRAGVKVGTVSHLRNRELVVALGPRQKVRAAIEAGLSAASAAGLVAVELSSATEGGRSQV